MLSLSKLTYNGKPILQICNQLIIDQPRIEGVPSWGGVYVLDRLFVADA
jgi:hypothetical protein